MTKLNILQRQMIERNLQWAYETSVRSHTWETRASVSPKDHAKASWVLNNRKHLERAAARLSSIDSN